MAEIVAALVAVLAIVRAWDIFTFFVDGNH